MAEKVYYNKLVRDRIQEKIHAHEESCEVSILSEDAFIKELHKKILEEATELAHTKTRAEFLQEYTDLMIVLDALTQHFEFSEADIQTAMTENVTKKGLYKNHHFLHWTQKK